MPIQSSIQSSFAQAFAETRIFVQRFVESFPFLLEDFRIVDRLGVGRDAVEKLSAKLNSLGRIMERMGQ